jgi:hypothetical protein
MSNVIRVIGNGKLYIGDQSGLSVVISGDLTITDRKQKYAHPRLPTIKRGQVWRYKDGDHYRVISVRGSLVRCLACDVDGLPIAGPDGKPQINDFVIAMLQYGPRIGAWRLIGGVT